MLIFPQRYPAVSFSFFKLHKYLFDIATTIIVEWQKRTLFERPLDSEYKISQSKSNWKKRSMLLQGLG